MGALMDEYARAAEESCRALEGTRAADWSRSLPDREESVRSLQAMGGHVVACARRYSDYIRKRRGLPHVEAFVQDLAELPSAAAIRPRLADALRYTEGALDGLYGAGEDEIA